ncbi:DUF2255 family protein [Mycobacteroides immunogenum]|uniref:Pyridoxamine 5'-phosphate oxidase n=1 Tax=Mycobacteroides immunogenum TaxID=83262 RepID=A0A7V8LTF3_9MYCO|nr:DUF2255 family protein [Mycobacteroides immunogenum]AMT74181.1 hypothetical protein ABG82_26125 [Mycobacteroides immunogenum]ANO06386.1 hypothetical protein BAB75_26385 [Mycobacteroides immunogenum]KIU37881.1 hypothetical protein TL11_25565 [Mycobacteroides immunogenum]KPG11451.1 hypothetical protein AN909_08035 [Mycobacteroides immunogenum]KPG12112.1 hypothetical protein AN910_13645 [Mycobacteroides immunogenum]
MALTRDQRDVLGAAHEVQVSTYRRDGTRRRPIPIWTVRVEDEVYVRSALGPDAAWYRNALKDNRLHVDAGAVAIDLALETAADAAINVAVDAAYRAKYPHGGSATTTMVTAPAVDTTVKLIALEGN